MYLSYTYLITNKITNQYYYGSRGYNVKLKRIPKDDLWIKYFTSSKKIKELIKKYGKDSFDAIIIMADPDYNVCYAFEQEIISKHLNNALCLNQYCRLTDKFSTSGTLLSNETKAKMSAAKKGKSTGPKSAETRAKMSAAKKSKVNEIESVPKERKPISAETRAKMSAASKNRKPPMEGKTHSAETKAKMSKTRKGKPISKGRVFSEEHKEKLSSAKAGENNPNYGKKHSEEAKAKMRLANELRRKNKE
jgi:hypothetical protein